MCDVLFIDINIIAESRWLSFIAYPIQFLRIFSNVGGRLYLLHTLTNMPLIYTTKTNRITSTNTNTGHTYLSLKKKVKKI